MAGAIAKSDYTIGITMRISIYKTDQNRKTTATLKMFFNNKNVVFLPLIED